MSVHLLLAAPGVGQLSTTAGYLVGTGRTVPTAAAVVGLVSAVLGGLALVRSARRPDAGRVGPAVGLLLGLISVVVGGVHGWNAAGGLGTGNGLAGAVVAVVLGAAGMLLGGLGLARARRSARPDEELRP